MNIMQKVYSALQALVAGRCYPNTLPQLPTYPAIVYQFVTNPPADTFSVGVRFTHFHVQVTLHSATYGALLALRQSALSAVEAMPEHITRDTDIEGPYEVEPNAFNWILGFHLRDAET